MPKTNAQRLVIGFDVGGTKTAAVIMEASGRILGRGTGGSGNTNFIPIDIANASYTKAIEDARKMAGIRKLKVEIAAVGTEPKPDPVAAIIRRLTGARRILHLKEGECSMVGGLVSKVGLSLICGTGSVGWGRNARGQVSMTSCWGPIGDEGSAYDIARRGVNAAFWAWDGRGDKTILVDKLLKMFGKKDMRDVCTPLYTSPNLRKDFASLNRLVTESATEGDRVSRQILLDCARQVAHFLATCADNLGMGKTPYLVASPTGGLVKDTDWRYFKMIQRELKRIHPKAKMVKPLFEPVVGAALVALDAIGVKWTPELVSNARTSLTVR